MNDLIDRQAAIDTVRSYMADSEIEDSDWHADGIAYEIKRLPSAQPEPKTGRWMFPDPPIHKPICSECGKPCIGLHAFEYVLTDYCPNCGAKMEGEDNGDGQ